LLSAQIIQNLEVIRKQATLDLTKLKTRTDFGFFFPAGSHHFGSFWTRDFCLSVEGLLVAGETEIVRNQIHQLLSMKGQNGLIPRGFDVIPPLLRVLRHTVFRILPGPGPGHHGRLKPEHVGEHRTFAFDSNALILMALGALEKKSQADFEKIKSSFDLSSILKAYLPFVKEGLVQQQAFSDWQDSARRENHGLFVNLCILIAAQESIRLNLPVPQAFEPQTFRKVIMNRFYDEASGLFSQFTDRIQIPLESNLWIATQNIFTKNELEQNAFAQKLMLHPVWNNPGVPIYPPSSAKEISWTTKAIGLKHYHDLFAWSWLLSDQAFAAFRLGDQNMLEKVTSAQAAVILQEKVIHEIYHWENEKLVPYNKLYKSEGPFTWGASRWLMAIKQIMNGL
jgi:hypothetical protein